MGDWKDLIGKCLILWETSAPFLAHELNSAGLVQKKTLQWLSTVVVFVVVSVYTSC